MPTQQILPGATLGVLGGGQLGRMFCVAARTMGYRVVVLDPDPLCGAGLIADVHIKADYTDQAGLEEMARQCDAITLEFENIPSESLRFIADKTTVYPVAESLEIAQNRDLEKQFALKAGLQPVPYFAIKHEDDLQQAASDVGFPAILKSNTLGYDGKGQFVVSDFLELSEAYNQAGKVDCVLEKKINIRCEVSAIVARNAAAELASFPVSENQHRNGILHMSIVPARVSEELTNQAIKNASPSANSASSPWNKFEGEMCKKACIKRASKTWPRVEVDDRLREAIDMLNESEGYEFGSDTNSATFTPDERLLALAAPKATQLLQYIETKDYWHFGTTYTILPEKEKETLNIAKSKGGFFSMKDKQDISDLLRQFYTEKNQIEENLTDSFSALSEAFLEGDELRIQEIVTELDEKEIFVALNSDNFDDSQRVVIEDYAQ